MLKWVAKLVRRNSDETIGRQLRETYLASYQATKVTLWNLLQKALSETHPTLEPAKVRKAAGIASNLMTAEPYNQKAYDGASAEVIGIAENLARVTLENDPELREMAVSASQAYALFFLGRAVNPKDMSVDEDDLKIAEACIDNAIKWGEAKADYYATASQVNMSWQRYGKAYELADAGVKIDPGNAEVTRMKGMAAYASGMLLEARTLLERTLVISPNIQGVKEPLALLNKELLAK